MFEVSNAIAYDNMMVDGVVGRSDVFALGDRDLWIDVSTPADGPKWNPAEGRYVLSVLSKIRERLAAAMDGERTELAPEWATTVGARNAELRRRLESAVFIISPFRDVVTGLSKYLRAVSGARLGTVQTTQGKEADILILVLGLGSVAAALLGKRSIGSTCSGGRGGSVTPADIAAMECFSRPHRAAAIRAWR